TVSREGLTLALDGRRYGGGDQGAERRRHFPHAAWLKSRHARGHMKLTRKFTFALICGVLVVQVGFAALRARREQRLFHVDIAREEKVLGHSLAISAQTVARTSGEELARDLIEKANLFDSHVQIRWVELDGAGEAWRPRATAADLAPVRSGEQVALELGEPDEVAVYTYSPITLPDGRVAAVEVSDSLRDEQEYL